MSGNKMIPVEEILRRMAQGPGLCEGLQRARRRVFARRRDDPGARQRRADAGAAGAAHEHDAGGDRAARKRPGQAVDAHARTARPCDRHEAADFVRAGDGAIAAAMLRAESGAYSSVNGNYAIVLILTGEQTHPRPPLSVRKPLLSSLHSYQVSRLLVASIVGEAGSSKRSGKSTGLTLASHVAAGVCNPGPGAAGYCCRGVP